ncbi:MAG: AraC family transcriptional regulator [Lachnospiraceae bacterium]|nr:AraC family transcriptional regulator [Lachnospiraceae bacterium]
MGLSSCDTVVDLHDRELAERGNAAFPIACYADNLSEKEVEWHWHEEWEYFIVSEGTAHLFLENVHAAIRKGDGVFINTKAMHSVKNDPQHPARLHSAVFHPRLIGGNADSIFWESLVQPLLSNEATRYILLRQEVAWEANVLKSLERAWHAIAFDEEDYALTARESLSGALNLMMRNTDFAASNLSGQELLKINRIRAMMEYIEAHYREDLTVEEIAASISVSSSVCLRCFHEMLGTTPMQYAIQSRLRKAEAMLRSGNRTAKDIALDCGFNDVSYFTRLFRKHYGSTPGQFRAVHRQAKTAEIMSASRDV